MNQRLSIFIGYYETEKQLKRTIRSLGSEVQKEANIDVKITIIDNSRDKTLKKKELAVGKFELEIKPTTCEKPIHWHIDEAVREDSSNYIGLCIDAARLCSSGVLKKAAKELRNDQKSIIHVPNYQLGPCMQMYAEECGFTEEKEESLLQDVSWPECNALSLKSIATMESHAGERTPIFESNALFISKQQWIQAGGYNKHFKRLDGGFASAEMLQRVLEIRPLLTIMASEGNFHQMHGGTTTKSASQTKSEIRKMTREYREIKNQIPKLYRGDVKTI